MYILINGDGELEDVAHDEMQYIDRFKKIMINELLEWVDNNSYDVISVFDWENNRHLRLNAITETYEKLCNVILADKLADLINGNTEPEKDTENESLKNLKFNEDCVIHTYNLAQSINIVNETYTIDKFNEFLEYVGWKVVTGRITVNPESSELKPVTYHE